MLEIVVLLLSREWTSMDVQFDRRLWLGSSAKVPKSKTLQALRILFRSP